MHTTALVLGPQEPGEVGIVDPPLPVGGDKVHLRPLGPEPYRGRRTELCSRSVEITWSPGDNVPLMAMFRASVELQVKTTWSARGQPNSFASLHRASYTAREACRALPWRPGGVAHGGHGVHHRVDDLGRLLPGGGRVVQIDQGNSSPMAFSGSNPQLQHPGLLPVHARVRHGGQQLLLGLHGAFQARPQPALISRAPGSVGPAGRFRPQNCSMPMASVVVEKV